MVFWLFECFLQTRHVLESQGQTDSDHSLASSCLSRTPASETSIACRLAGLQFTQSKADKGRNQFSISAECKNLVCLKRATKHTKLGLNSLPHKHLPVYQKQNMQRVQSGTFLPDLRIMTPKQKSMRKYTNRMHTWENTTEQSPEVPLVLHPTPACLTYWPTPWRWDSGWFAIQCIQHIFDMQNWSKSRQYT